MTQLQKETRDSSPYQISRPIIKALLFIFLVLLLIFRNTQHIADRMFWLDEVIAFKTAINPFFDIPLDAILFQHQMQPPLFFWLGHFAAKIGTDPLTLRSVSVLCYIILIGFIIFLVKEFKLGTRFFLCFVLIISPFAKYAVTEFRPYALAALSILVSSILLFRLIRHPHNRKHAWLYGLSALMLQYSLTLNCFVFGIQMLFVFSYLIWSSFNGGLVQTAKVNKPLLLVSLILCSQYIIFLAYVTSQANGVTNSSVLAYSEKLVQNFKILASSVKLPHPSLSNYLVIILFIIGSSVSFWFNPWITSYLASILLGQLFFSTYLTYATIPWFAQRYLVASYVAFALLTAMGTEFILNRFKSRVLVILVAGAALGVIYSELTEFRHSLSTTHKNPSKQAIEKLRCRQHTSIVLTDPQYWSPVPWYIYRNDESVEVPTTDIDISKTIEMGVLSNDCFILQEERGHRRYSGEAFEKLNSLPAYNSYKVKTEGGKHVPGSAWLFSPG